MSKKSPKIAALLAGYADGPFPAHYQGFFACFNDQLFYEAHDVLEELWLAEGRSGANYGFYKGLIQLAGAFVHLQKGRLPPAVSLFNLAEANLQQFPVRHQGLDLAAVLTLLRSWRFDVEAGQFVVNPLRPDRVPWLAPPRLAA